MYSTFRCLVVEAPLVLLAFLNADGTFHLVCVDQLAGCVVHCQVPCGRVELTGPSYLHVVADALPQLVRPSKFLDHPRLLARRTKWALLLKHHCPYCMP